MTRNRKIFNIVLSIISVIIFWIIASTAFADNRIEQIRAVCHRINKTIEMNKAKEILFYTDGDGYVENKWNKVKNVEERLLFDKSFFRAKVYLYSGKIVKSIIVIDSQVGDWTNIKEYYFYENGSIAFVFERHVTSQAHNTETGEELPQGPYILEKRTYFDEKGRKIKSIEKAVISSTNREIPVKFVRQIDLGDDLYLNSSLLPFSKMLEK